MIEIKELLAKIGEITDKYTTIDCKFSTNTRDWNKPKEDKKKVGIKWVLYISDITSSTGNSFPEFNTFRELESYVNILILELRRIKTTAIEDAVQNAIDILDNKTNQGT